MKLKDLINKGNLAIKTKVERDGERFSVSLKLDLSREELLALGLSEPRVKGKGPDVGKQPTLKELVLQGFDNVNKRLDVVDKRLDKMELQLEEVRSLPAIKKELDKSKIRER